MADARTIGVVVLSAPALIFFVLAWRVFAAMNARGAGLRTPAAPKGGISLQKAGTCDRAVQILVSWGLPGIATAQAQLADDRVFIRHYTAFFAFAGLAAIVALGWTGLTLAAAAVGWLAVVATTAGLDTRENVGLAELLAAGPDAVSRGGYDDTIRRTRRLAQAKFGGFAFQSLALLASIAGAVAAW
jgi:hypothetical protein